MPVIVSVVLAALVALGMLGCGPSGSKSSSTPPAFRVALLTPGSITDGGWNQAAYEGLVRVRDELGAEIRNEETKTPTQFEEGFRDYARRGFQLVFGHGFEYQEAAAKVAAEFPSTVFVTTSGDTVRPNVAPMVFELEQATYLCGLLAGRATQSKIVGMIGGMDLPSIRSTFLAFQAGAAAATRGVRVRDIYLGNFQDVGAAREAALALMEEGADFLIHQANDAGRGVFQAVEERAAGGAKVYAFGTNRDQNEMAPSVIAASAVLDVPAAFLLVAKRVKDATFRGEAIRLGMKDGIVSFVPNAAVYASLPDDARNAVSEAEARIRSGELVVPRGNF